MKFEDLDSFKEFAGFLSKQLEAINEIDLSREIEQFRFNTYTTTSEYLGEYRLLLMKVIKLKLNEITQLDIENAIRTINKAFE